MQLTNELSISGMPVVDNGKLMGIVTRRDFRYADNLSELVSSIMTPYEKLITVKEGFDQEEVKKLMYKNRSQERVNTIYQNYPKTLEGLRLYLDKLNKPDLDRTRI